MKSKWSELKPKAISLRENGKTIAYVEKTLGIPRSTLSYWFKNIVLTPKQLEKLGKESKQRFDNARAEAVKWHNAGKSERLARAELQAEETLKALPLENSALTELALAFLYLGEGAKNDRTSLGSSNPEIASFYINTLRSIYQVPNDKIKGYLHLRADQNETELKLFWSQVLDIPVEQFGKSSFDKRTAGRPTHENYKGVCTIECGLVEIQRKLMYIASGYCEKVATNITQGG